MKTALGIGMVIGALLTAFVFALIFTERDRSEDTETTALRETNTTVSTVSENIPEEMVEEEPTSNIAVGDDRAMEFPTLDESALILVGRNLTAVPSFVFDRTDLTLLDLSDNTLTSVQAEIGRLTNLTTLDLSHNTLTNIPAELGKLTKLRTLDLSYNKLTGLPYELGNLTNLTTLDLRGNAYAVADLEIIRKGLPNTEILVGE